MTAKVIYEKLVSLNYIKSLRKEFQHDNNVSVVLLKLFKVIWRILSENEKKNEFSENL